MTKTTTERFAALVRGRLEEMNLSVRAAARSAGLPERSVQNVIDGKAPSIDRAADICEALDLELYLGPPRDALLADSLRAALRLAQLECPGCRDGERVHTAVCARLREGLEAYEEGLGQGRT